MHDTPCNFRNALSVLEVGEWDWRVGYGVGTEDGQWSVARSFTIAGNATRWDRGIIDEGASRLAELGHPRVGPTAGRDDWHGTLDGDPLRR